MFSQVRSCLSFANNCLGCNEKTVLSNFLHHVSTTGVSPRRRIVVPSFGKTFLLSSKLQLSVRFFPYSVLNEQSIRYLLFNKYLVGLSGLEPPTSRLSGGCSNQLSYKPVDLPAVSDSGGDDGIRTHDPLLAGQVLSQLSYTPVRGGGFWQTASDADLLISPRRCTSYSERTRSRGEKALESRWKNPKDFILFLLFGKEPSFNCSIPSSCFFALR